MSFHKVVCMFHDFDGSGWSISFDELADILRQHFPTRSKNDAGAEIFFPRGFPDHNFEISKSLADVVQCYGVTCRADASRCCGFYFCHIFLMVNG